MVVALPSLPVLVTMTVRKLVMVERPAAAVGSAAAASLVTTGTEDDIDSAPDGVTAAVGAEVERALVGGVVELLGGAEEEEEGTTAAMELELGGRARQLEPTLIEVMSWVMGLVTSCVDVDSAPCESKRARSDSRRKSCGEQVRGAHGKDCLSRDESCEVAAHLCTSSSVDRRSRDTRARLHGYTCLDCLRGRLFGAGSALRAFRRRNGQLTVTVTILVTTDSPTDVATTSLLTGIQVDIARLVLNRQLSCLWKGGEDGRAAGGYPRLCCTLTVCPALQLRSP